nr:immunoglobulin heavy chain junction region [Macaca mulatta]
CAYHLRRDCGLDPW